MTYQLQVIDHESAVLTGNPLGDPVRREILVLSPARPIDEPLPVAYLLSGFGSGGRDLLAARPLGESLTDRLSRLVSTGTLPPAHVVLPDCTTRYGGSQYLDSPMCGPYQSYLIDEYGMRWGARALHRALERAGVPHTYEEHDGGHQGIEHRLEHSLANIDRHWST